MSADELEATLDALRTARAAVDDEAADRLETPVDRVETALEAGRTLDHGALARITRTLDELAEDADGEAAAALSDAKAAVSAYREGVPGA